MERDGQSGYDDRDHAHQLDQDVQRRARRILERVAHRVAYDRSLVVVRSLAAEVALLDEFLCVVPGSARVGHENGQHEARAQAAYQQSHHACHSEDKADRDRYENREYRREQHLALRALGRDRHAAGIVRCRFSFEYALDLTELSPYFLHHALGGATYGIHRKPAEQECHHRADEGSHQNVRIHQRDLEIVHQVQNVCVGYGFHRSVGQLERTLPDVLHADLDFLDV